MNLSKHAELLRREYEYEKAAFKRDSQTMGIERKKRRGDCWFPVTTGRARYNSLDRFTVEIIKTETDDADHNFEYGRAVCFSLPMPPAARRSCPSRARCASPRTTASR